MNVFVSSAGRRNYLLKWFHEAGSIVGTEIQIIAADGDPCAPALAEADIQVILPSINSAEYVDAVVDACETHDVQLLLSLHDYDIMTLSTGALDKLNGVGVIAAVPPKATLDIVVDKLQTATTLLGAGLLVPQTTHARDGLTVEANHDPTPGRRWIVKHRYGSGSSGVLLVEGQHLDPAILVSSLSAPSASGARSSAPDRSLVVIQEAIEGEEFGLDIVCDFSGTYHGVLARRKLRMRAGETDRAVSVDSAPFQELAASLASTLQLRGNTDVDVIVTANGEQYIIDINPRFGGGYPFVHVAGANVPACYLAWAKGLDIDPRWLEAQPDVTSSKYEAICGPRAR